jgi:GDP-L-fucose synthase
MLPSRIWVAGHRGMLGSAVVRRLAREPVEVLTVGRETLDLTDRAAVGRWLAEHRPEGVVLAAARVGGILANRDQPAAFLHDNLAIALNVIGAAHEAGVRRLLFVASSAAYPKAAPQPITEDALLTGPLDPAHEPYAVAKIAGIALCQAYRRQHGDDFIAAIPTNLYGPADTFDPVGGHVVPALMLKAHEARLAGAASLQIWGTGTPRRDLLHVDDCADALIHLLARYSDERPINVGSGSDLTVRELAEKIARIVGFDGAIVTDPQKPDGTMRKLLSIERIRASGWSPTIDLDAGLAETYRWLLERMAADGSQAKQAVDRSWA